MNIAIYHNLPPGGAKRSLYEECKYLSKNHSISLYILSSNIESFLDIRPFCEKVTVYDFEVNSKLPGSLSRIHRDVQNFFNFKNVHFKIAEDINGNNHNISLIHPDKYTQSPYVLRYLQVPSLYYCEEFLRIVYEKQLAFIEQVSFYKKWYESITRKYRKKIDKNNSILADLLVANSYFTKSNIDKAYDVKAKVCQLGVDVEIFKNRSTKTKEYLLFIGETTKENAFDFLTRSAREVVGRSTSIRKLGFSKGKLMVNNDNILSKEYSDAIATLCTQHNEPFGLAPLESMACETPVLAVNEGGYRETVIDGVTGFLLPRDPRLFAEKIEWLMDNPDEARRMGKAGREHVKKNFTWEKHNKCIEKLLIETANAKK